MQMLFKKLDNLKKKIWKSQVINLYIELGFLY